MKTYAIGALTVIALTAGATSIVWFATSSEAEAHCQVPCGIYDDPARIAFLREDAVTIAKAMNQISVLAGKHDAQAFNQAARWVATKETHATHIIDVVSEYFLTQKVKPAAAGDGYQDYLGSLADHHAVMVAAMKCKQSVAPATVTALNAAIDKLATHYAAPAGRADAGGPHSTVVAGHVQDHDHGGVAEHAHGEGGHSQAPRP